MAASLLALVLTLTTGCFNSISLLSFEDLLRSNYQEVIVEEGDKDKILLLDIDGVITSGPQQQSGLFSIADSTVNSVIERLKKAEEDKSIKAVVLRIDSPGGGVTASDIIYEQIEKFKTRTDLPVYASFLDMSASGGYYISMAADEIYAHPTTITGSIGVIAVFLNVSELGDKIGLKANIIKSGANKDVGSPFKEMPADQREILTDMINAMQDRFIEVVQAGRPELSAEKVVELADGRPYTADQALENGLIDGILYTEEVIDRVRQVEFLQDASVILYRKISQEKVDSVYAQSTPPNPKAERMTGDINVGLINVSELSLANKSQPVFYYLWNPSF